ncbi:hypothetical protein VPH35_014035 [Triticum aestivum]
MPSPAAIALPPPPPPPTAATADGFDGFFDAEGAALPPPPPPDRLQIAPESSIADVLAAPLSFKDAKGQASGVHTDSHGTIDETLSSCMQPDLILACHTPAPAVAMGLQLGAVTQQVQQLQIGGPRHLFQDVQAPLIVSAPSCRPSAPPKTRASSTPRLQSVRQTATASKVPVAQRASLLLVRKLGKLGPKEEMIIVVDFFTALAWI